MPGLLVLAALFAAQAGAVRPPRTPHRPLVTCTLTNGDRVTGQLLAVHRRSIRLTRTLVGRITLRQSAIALCETSDSVAKRRLARYLLPDAPPLLTAALPDSASNILFAVLTSVAIIDPLPIPTDTFTVDTVTVPLAARALPTYVSTVGWRRTLGFSYAMARGNSNTSDLGFTGGLAVRTTRSQATLTTRRLHGKQNGQSSADYFSTNLRDDQALGRNDSAAARRPSFFVETTYEHDAIAKLAGRVLGNSGLSIPLSSDPKSNLALEVGVGFTHENYTTGVNHTRAGGVLRLAGRQMFGLANADQQLALFPDLGDQSGHYRVNGDFNLGAPLSKKVSLRVGLSNRYDTRPQFQVKKLDVMVQSGLGLEF